MKKTATTRATRKPGDPPMRGNSDWERLDRMTDDEVIAAARSDPDAQPLTKGELARFRRVSPVKVLRERLNMTQQAFADAYRIPVATLRDWEQGRSRPDAPARA